MIEPSIKFYYFREVIHYTDTPSNIAYINVRSRLSYNRKVIFCDFNTGKESKSYALIWKQRYTFQKDKKDVKVDKLCAINKWEI